MGGRPVMTVAVLCRGKGMRMRTAEAYDVFKPQVVGSLPPSRHHSVWRTTDAFKKPANAHHVNGFRRWIRYGSPECRERSA